MLSAQFRTLPIFLRFLFILLSGTVHANLTDHCTIQVDPTLKVSEGIFQANLWLGLPKEIQARVVGKSWKDHPLCPRLEDLAYMQVTHWNLEGEIAVGELVFHVKAAEQFVAVFKELFHIQFPIHKMRLIDDYDADDERSMQDNNSSCFCFRMATFETWSLSNHALGLAVDINPLFNPFISNSLQLMLPDNAGSYIERETVDCPGSIHVRDDCYHIFQSHGFEWGGDWSMEKDGCIDYQHFEILPITLGL